MFPKGSTPVALTRSFLVVTMRSIKVLDVIVCLVASCMTFSILNISKMVRSLLVTSGRHQLQLVPTDQYGFRSIRKLCGSVSVDQLAYQYLNALPPSFNIYYHYYFFVQVSLCNAQHTRICDLCCILMLQ